MNLTSHPLTSGPLNQMGPCITSPTRWPSPAPKLQSCACLLPGQGLPFYWPILPKTLLPPISPTSSWNCSFVFNPASGSEICVCPGIWCEHPSATWSWSTLLPLLFLLSRFWLLLSREGQHWVSHKADLRQIISYKCVRITAEFVLSIKLCEIYMCSFSCLFNTEVPTSGGNVPFYPSFSIMWRS